MAIGNPITLTSNVASKTLNVIATASQSLFTVNGGYRINEIAVFRNGVRLVDGRDFTARDGSTVTPLSAATEGDAVEFQIFDTFRIADAITPFDSDQTIAGNLNITGILSASQLGSVNFNVTSGIQTFNDVRVGGALTVAGTLTYEDTTNTNTTGIATFSGGMNISGVGATVTTLNATGVSTFAGAISVGDTISLGDHDRLRFGAGNDLQIYHDTSNSRIVDSGTGQLILQSNQFRLLNAAGSENLIDANENGAVTLYYDASTKFETGPAGTITVCVGTLDGLSLGDNEKALFGAGDDLQIYHDGTNTIIENTTGNLYILDNDAVILGSASGTGSYFKGVKDGAAELYYDNSKKFETIGAGATVTGEMHATTFHGDGSQLTGVAAAGSGSGDLDITSCLFI